MRWLGAELIAPETASGAVVRLTTAQPSWRLRVAVPISAVTAITGVSLLLAPAMVAHTLFQLLLLPVLGAALGLGLRAALLAVAVGATAVTLALPPVGLPWVADPTHAPELALFLAEGAMIAFIGAIVRATIALAGAAAPAPADARRRQPFATDSFAPVGPLLVERLTARETEVLQLAASGRSVDELADDLCVSANTVKTHLAHCYDKLGAHNRAEAVALAVHCGSLQPADLGAALEGHLSAAVASAS